MCDPLAAWQSRGLRLTAPPSGRRAPRASLDSPSRRGGRVVECAALEMRCAGNRTVGSNPTLSASRPFRRAGVTADRREVDEPMGSEAERAARSCPKDNPTLSASQAQVSPISRNLPSRRIDVTVNPIAADRKASPCSRHQRGRLIAQPPCPRRTTRRPGRGTGQSGGARPARPGRPAPPGLPPACVRRRESAANPPRLRGAGRG